MNQGSSSVAVRLRCVNSASSERVKSNARRATGFTTVSARSPARPSATPECYGPAGGCTGSAKVTLQSGTTPLGVSLRRQARISPCRATRAVFFLVVSLDCSSGVVEVEAAGGIQGVFGCAGEDAGG